MVPSKPFVFPVPDVARFPDTTEPYEEPDEEDPPGPDWAELQPLLDELHPLFAEVLLLREQGLAESAIAKLYGISQGAVSNRLQKAKRAMQFAIVRRERCGTIERGDVLEDLGCVLGEYDCRLCWLLHKTTSQSEVAREVGSTQGHVRAAYLRILARLRYAVQIRPELSRYLLAMELLQGRWSALHMTSIYQLEMPTVIRAGESFPRAVLHRRVNPRPSRKPVKPR